MRGPARIGDDVSALAQFCQDEPPGLWLINPHIGWDLYPLGLRIMTNDGELIARRAETGSQACAVGQTTLHQKGEGDINRQIFFLDDASTFLLLILVRLSEGKRMGSEKEEK